MILIIFVQFILLPIPKAQAATSPSLGTAATYSVTAGSSVTNTGATTIAGNVGISPGAGGSPNYTGFGTVTLGGVIHDADGTALTAMSDRTTAYTALASQGCTTDYGGVTTDLAGKTLVPGVYCSTSFHLTGTLTLNGAISDVWIFKSASDLIMTGGSAVKVVFTGGGQPCNVWWRVVSTATFDANSTLVGNILADTSITLAAGASLDGRALARTAEVTLSSNSITGPTCGAGAGAGEAITGATAGTATTSSPTTSSPTSGGPPARTCPVISYNTPFIVESRRVDSDSIFLRWAPENGVNTFTVQYGMENGNWLYSTDVTGFSTTINGLPANQPIWVRVASTDYCSVGTYSEAKLVGGTASGNLLSPKLPNTGNGPNNYNNVWQIPASIAVLLPFLRNLIHI